MAATSSGPATHRSRRARAGHALGQALPKTRMRLPPTRWYWQSLLDAASAHTLSGRSIAMALTNTTLAYMPGFGNDFETESLPGALPQGQNSPQRCAYGLYAEQLSGSPFTAPRGTNERSWLYRIRPSVRHAGHFKKIAVPHWKTAPAFDEHELPIGQLRWGPVPIPSAALSFVEGMRTMTTAGDVNTQAGMAAHVMLDDAGDGGRLLLQRRRRDADRAAAGQRAFHHRVRHHRGRAWRRLRHPARRQVQGRSRSTAPRAATSARTTAPSSRCPTAGRSAPTASPMRATSRRRSPPSRTRRRRAG